MKKIYFFLLLVFASTKISAQYSLTVAQDGSGNYTTVQAAINAAPTGQTVAYTIYIKNGKYKEQITVPSNKPFIQLIGQSVADVVLYFDSYAGAPVTGGGTVGTQNSASFTINASDFAATNITFANTFNYDSVSAAGITGLQAVAVTINADRSAFKNCRFLGNQDTLYTKGSGAVRHYFKNCYIDGIIDFIFGSSIDLFDSCVVYPKSRLAGGNSYITAANTPPGQSYGYVFRDCRVLSNSGNTMYYLGRPWQNSTGSSPLANNKVVFLASRLPYTVRSDGWSTWDAGTNTSLIYNGEYKSRNLDGSLTNVASRVTWSYQLSQADSATYTFANLFGTWDPCSVATGFCTNTTTSIAVSNFRATKGSTTSTLDWNISWPIPTVKYELFRSTDNIAFSKINELTSAVTNDTAVNFNLTDAVPPAGSIYYYYLKASKTGYNTHNTDTVKVSSAPTISVTGTLGSFVQSIGTPSATQTYTVSGTNMVANITITPPSPFEISNNGGTNWYNSTTQLTLTPTSGTLANTTITVRLNSASLGNFFGNVVHATTGTGATNVNAPVTGATTNAPVVTFIELQQWPFTLNANDSASVRSAAVTASTPTFKNLALSNGTTVSTVPAYSTAFGQAFSASTNGDGSWGTSVGGPGGNLNRTNYEQFTVTAAPGYSIRLDSIIMTASFYFSSSNTKFGIVYSKTGFTTADSTDVTGVISPFAASDSGTFAKAVGLLNQTNGPTSVYRFSIAGSTGVVLTAGQTLTFRVYMSCGSGSTGRYCTFKNVIAKGAIVTPTPLQLLSFNAGFNGNTIKATWTTINEVNTNYFVVERSSNANNFTALGTVVAKNTVANSSYNFIDANPISGVSYYRLKMFDKDGSYTYSRVVIVNSKLKGAVAIFPNPTTDALTVTYAEVNVNTSVEIFTVDGKKVHEQKLNVGSTQTTIDVSKMPLGNYLLVITDGSNKNTIKFVKQ